MISSSDSIAHYVASAPKGEARQAANTATVGGTKILILLMNELSVVAYSSALVKAAEVYKAEGNLDQFNMISDTVKRIAAAYGVRSS